MKFLLFLTNFYRYSTTHTNKQTQNIDKKHNTHTLKTHNTFTKNTTHRQKTQHTDKKHNSYTTKNTIHALLIMFILTTFMELSLLFHQFDHFIHITQTHTNTTHRQKNTTHRQKTQLIHYKNTIKSRHIMYMFSTLVKFTGSLRIKMIYSHFLTNFYQCIRI